MSACFGCHKTQKSAFPAVLARDLHEAKKWQLVPQVEQPTQRPLVFLLAPHGHRIPQQFDSWGSYTMFSAPGRGPCGGPRSCLLCSWASCRTGMLHSGHTFRTSSHLIRHLQSETTQQEEVSPMLVAPAAHMPHGLNTSVPRSQGPV